VQENLGIMVEQISKDLNPEKVHIKSTASRETIKIEESDSCIVLDKDHNMVVRLSKSNPKTGLTMLAFLLQMTSREGHEAMKATLEEFEEYCLGPETGRLDELDDFPDDSQEVIEKVQAAIQEGEKVGGKCDAVIQVHMIPLGDFADMMFEDMPELPGVRNLKIIIEE